MARTFVIGVGITLLSMTAGDLALAKGKTVKLAVSGPGIAEPIELTHQSAISAGVWSGTFMNKQNGPIEAPASEIPRYMVQFHVQLNDEVRMMYVIYYVWDIANHRALIQIPGVEDQWYRLNVSSISRCCQGRWFYASEPWGETIRAALPLQD